MNLPKTTFLKKQCQLFASDFECNDQLKPHRAMQLMQDAATAHAAEMGLGWYNMDKHGLLWILSKVHIEFDRPLTRGEAGFDLYTWPLAPNRFYSERCFAAVQNGKQVFSATSLWMIIDRDSRKIVPAEKMNEFFHGEYDATATEGLGNFARVRYDETFAHAYSKTVRRSDLDFNGHVNNTNYISYALDVLNPTEQIKSVQIVYNKELVFGDVVEVYFKREGGLVIVVGLRQGETCFTTVLQTID